MFVLLDVNPGTSPVAMYVMCVVSASILWCVDGMSLASYGSTSDHSPSRKATPVLESPKSIAATSPGIHHTPKQIVSYLIFT